MALKTHGSYFLETLNYHGRESGARYSLGWGWGLCMPAIGFYYPMGSR